MFEDPKPKSPRSHVWMGVLSGASFLAWLAASGQDYKTLVLLVSFLLTVIVLITCVGHVFGFKPGKLAIVVAAALALASCVGQCHMNMRDHERVVSEMHGLTCAEALRIRKTGHGLGRTWVYRGYNEWRGAAPGPLRYWDLYLLYKPDTNYYYMKPGSMGDDMGSAMTFCGPGSTSTLPDVSPGPRS